VGIEAAKARFCCSLLVNGLGFYLFYSDIIYRRQLRLDIKRKLYVPYTKAKTEDGVNSMKELWGKE